MSTSGWVGVDLDGTLARYDGWAQGGIGEPVPAMLARVKQWLKDGITVKIFTARVGTGAGYSSGSGRSDDDDFVREQRLLIEEWCERHFGQKLPVTAAKDFAMDCLYDDRCVQVEMNTGRLIGVDNQ